MADSRKVTVQFLGDDKNLGRTTSSVNSKLGKLGGAFAKFGVAAAAGLAVATAAAAKGLYEIGEQFDDATDKIRVSTGATGERLAQFENDLKAVAKNTASPLADVGDAIAEVAQRLDLTDKPLRTVSKQMLDLSRITGTDLGSNVESITRLFGDWSVKTKDMSGAMDKLFRASQATGLPVDQLAASMVQFGSPLRQLGFDFETTAALLGKFEKEGVNSNLVMGSMRIALGKMAREGEPAQETLARVTEEIKNAGSVSEANALALELFGAKAGPDMAAAIREGRFEVSDLIKTIGSGRDTIQKASNDTADFAEKWQIFKNKLFIALEPLATRVFGAFGDGMDYLTPRAEVLFRKFHRDLGPAIQQFSQWVQTRAVPALREFGDWFSKNLAPALEDFYRNRLATIIDGIGDLRAAFNRNQPELERFGQWLKRAGEWTGKYLIPVMSKLSNQQLKTLFKALAYGIDVFALWVRWAGFVGNSLKRVGNYVKALSAPVVAVMGVFVRFDEVVNQRINSVASTVRSLPGKIRAAFSNPGAILEAAGRAIIDGLASAMWSATVSRLAGTLHAITTYIKDHKGPIEKDRVLLRPAGLAIMEGLARAIGDGKKPLEKVLDKVTDYVSKAGDKLASLLSKRKDIMSSFQGMTSSVFSADLTNPETGVGPTVAGLLDYQRRQAAQARQIKADVAKAQKLGLSPSLIKQFLASGESGIANLHALASGTSADVAQLNSLNAATNSALGAAGMSTAGYLGVNDQIKTARDQLASARKTEHYLAKIEKHLAKNEVATVTLKGSDLIVAIRKAERKKGHKVTT